MGIYDYKITDAQKNEIGRIRGHNFNFGWPFVKDRRGCTIKLISTNEKFRLTTYLSFGERYFGGTEGSYHVSCKVDKYKIPYEFKVTKDGRKIAHMYRKKLSNDFTFDGHIIGYDKKDDENVAVIISLAISLILKAS